MPSAAWIVAFAVNLVGLLAVVWRGGQVLGRVETLLTQIIARVETIGPRVHEQGNTLVRLDERLDNLGDRVTVLEDTDRNDRRKRDEG